MMFDPANLLLPIGILLTTYVFYKEKSSDWRQNEGRNAPGSAILARSTGSGSLPSDFAGELPGRLSLSLGDLAQGRISLFIYLNAAPGKAPCHAEYHRRIAGRSCVGYGVAGGRASETYDAMKALLRSC
jgi:hypothetical protein